MLENNKGKLIILKYCNSGIVTIKQTSQEFYIDVFACCWYITCTDYNDGITSHVSDIK